MIIGILSKELENDINLQFINLIFIKFKILKREKFELIYSIVHETFRNNYISEIIKILNTACLNKSYKLSVFLIKYHMYLLYTLMVKYR